MQKTNFLKVIVIGLMVLFFSSKVGADMVGNWEDKWSKRERVFNSYMKKDYIRAKTGVVKFAKANASAEEYRIEKEKLTDVKNLYKVIQGKSRLIGTYLRTIDRDYRNKDRMENFLKFFKTEIKKFEVAKNDYLRLMKDLKGKEDIDQNKLKYATKALKHISANLAAEYKQIKNMPTEASVEALDDFNRKTIVSNMANSISQAKYAIAKVKNKPTVATWTKNDLMKKACRDVQMAIGGFKRYDQDFDNADHLQQVFMTVYENQMIKMIKREVRRGENEKDSVLDAIKIIEKDLKRVNRSFKKYKRSL